MRGWMLLAVVDLLWAAVLAMVYGDAPMTPFHGVATVVTNPSWMPALEPTLALGIAAHFGVALAWTSLYLLLQRNVDLIRRISETRRGQFALAAVLGPIIWIVMSRAVIPTMMGRAASALSVRWAIQLIGHVFFVGVPLVFGVGRAPRGSNA
jgi:hypothetical protein